MIVAKQLLDSVSLKQTAYFIYKKHHQMVGRRCREPLVQSLKCTKVSKSYQCAHILLKEQDIHIYIVIGHCGTNKFHMIFKNLT